MKSIRNGLLLALLFVTPLLAQQKVSLTLKDAVEYALENNVEAKNAKLENLAAQAIIRENLSRGLPQVNATFDFTHNLAIPVIFLPGGIDFGLPGDNGNGGGGQDVQEVRFGVDYQSSLNLRVDQMIFDGSYFVGLKAARTLSQLTKFDEEKAQNDVIENIKKAYYTVMVNEERRKLLEANLGRLDALLKETEALFEAGFAEKLEVSRVKVQRNNLKADLDRIVSASRVSKQLLKLQLGLPQNLDLELLETLEEMNKPEELAELLANNGYRRVEVDQLEKNLELAELEKRNNLVQYIPTLNGFLTYQRAGAALDFNNIFRNDWFTGAFVGVSMNIPIFDGFQKRSRIQQNRVQIKQLENQRYFLSENILLEQLQAKEELRATLAILEVQRENKALALEVFEMTKTKYTEGVGANLEVVEADAALKEAEANYYAALYDALVAKVDLEKALGIL